MNTKVVQSKEYAEFVTVTCLDWLPLLSADSTKDLIVESLRFLWKAERISVYAFVIMPNHFHLVWQMLGDHARGDVQRDFLKFTAQHILNRLRKENSPILKTLQVNLADRRYQVWRRRSLGIPLWSERVIWQKVNYIHNNPIRARLCKYPENYKYSSAAFYLRKDKRWDFLEHVDG